VQAPSVKPVHTKTKEKNRRWIDQCDEMSFRSLLFIAIPEGPLGVEVDLTNFTCA